jgi:hypothetical protein
MIDLETAGAFLAISGSLVSIYGALLNNLFHNHIGAMKVWTFSNVFLMIWSYGNSLHLWNGGLPSAFMGVMYSIFTVTNWYGLRKYHKKPL